MKDARNWIILNPHRHGRLECLRCGKHHVVEYPIEMWAMTALTKGFSAEHAKCRLGAHGLHCSRCGETGHEPDACPGLRVTTPEQWLAGTDTGISSCVIYGSLHNPNGYVRSFSPSPPMDPSDFGRCYRLLKLFPHWLARLGEVATKHPAWAPFVREWDLLTELYEQEIPSGKCPKLFELMLTLEKS
jgi:hypothetical protein